MSEVAGEQVERDLRLRQILEEFVVYGVKHSPPTKDEIERAAEAVEGLFAEQAEQRVRTAEAEIERAQQLVKRGIRGVNEGAAVG